MTKVRHIGDSPINIDDVYDGSISADACIGQTLYAVTSVQKYGYGGSAAGTFSPGATIGTIYSWINAMDGSGNIWWMIQPSDYDPTQTYYVPMVKGTLSLTNLGFIQAIAQTGQAATLATAQQAVNTAQDTWQYYLNTYLPWVVGGALGIFALSAILKNHKS